MNADEIMNLADEYATSGVWKDEARETLRLAVIEAVAERDRVLENIGDYRLAVAAFRQRHLNAVRLLQDIEKRGAPLGLAAQIKEFLK